jgi:hypothetical protein
VNPPAMNQPYVIVMGPPNVRPVLYSVVIPVKTEIIAKEKAKLERSL